MSLTILAKDIVIACLWATLIAGIIPRSRRWSRPVRYLFLTRTKITSSHLVVELRRQVPDVCRLYGAEDKLGFQITEGPHEDTQNLRVHAFNWTNRFLKGDPSPIRTVADAVFEPSEL